MGIFIDKYARKSRKRVFLGGTCNNSTWRETMEMLLDKNGIDYFNPVVDDWTEDDYKRELEERKLCTYCLYVITPNMTGMYSIAEVVDDSNKRPSKTVFVILEKDGNKIFDKSVLKSLYAVKKMVHENGSACFDSLEDASEWIAESW